MDSKRNTRREHETLDRSGKLPSTGLEASHAYERGVRDSQQRLREMSSRSYEDTVAGLDSTSEDVLLPGIPSRSVGGDSLPGGQGRSRKRSVDLSGSSLPRSRSTQEESYSKAQKPQTRHRTRTLDEGTQDTQLTNIVHLGGQPVHPIPEDDSIEDAHDDSFPTVWTEDTYRPRLVVPHPCFMEHLMRRTRGQMQGRLLYRRDHSHEWMQGYCSLSASSGSLVRQSKHERVTVHKLIPDLRGCQVQAVYDARKKTPILHVSTRGRTAPYELVPLASSDLSVWFAAILCWQAVRSHRTLHAYSEDAELTPLSAPVQRERHRAKDTRAVERDVSIIRTAKLMFWNGDASAWPTGGETNPHWPTNPTTPVPMWSEVSCILRENGELKLLTSTDAKVVATVWLSKLNRSAVQRLCSSVLEKDRTIAIYPQYARAADSSSRLQPLYLHAHEPRVYETWFVLLRAFTLPELYGPVVNKDADSLRSPEMLPGLSAGAAGDSAELFRVERSLNITIGEFRPVVPPSTSSTATGTNGEAAEPNTRATAFYAQVLIDGLIKAKTRLRIGSGDMQWYQTLEILDLPPTVSFVTIQLRRLKATVEFADDRTLTQTNYTTNSHQDEDSSFAATHTENDIVGELIVPFTDPRGGPNASRRWQVLNVLGRSAGDLSLELQLDRDVILLDQEYSVLSELLHDFTSDLTLQMADVIPPDKLSSMSDHLLNIFQASNTADEWLQALAEEEIDGIRRSGPAGRLRMNGRAESNNDSRESLAAYGPAVDREGLLRDLKRATIAEANLLFRGNTLLSKALDGHMQRLGREYLETTLGPKMREISSLDQDIEVDPSKISATASLNYNWHRLSEVVQSVWSLIRDSAPRCPVELRIIFRHIRACADEKYGGRLKNIPYASVSGFLFLRFFCPAILNPFMFGLVRDFPGPRAQRGFTLIAKTLQGLANQTTFGAKEPWLEQMNNFLKTQRGQFRDFIDEVCAVPATAQPASSTDYHKTALSTFSRLNPASKEGWLSLPHLIDSSRSFAALVDLWLSNFVYNPTDRPLDHELLQFHNVCMSLKQQTRDLFNRAERGVKRSSNLVDESAAIATLMETHPDVFWVDFPIAPGNETTLEDKAAPATPKVPQKTPEVPAAAPSSSEGTKRPRKGSEPASRPSTSESIGRGTRSGMVRRFRSRSRSRAASPLRVSEKEASSPITSAPDEAQASSSEVKASRKAKGKEREKEKEKDKDKSKEKDSQQRRGLFGKRKSSKPG